MDSYAPHTVFNFESEVAGKDTIISILQKDYPYPGLTPKVRRLGAAPVLRREQRDRIHGSSLQIFAQSDIDGEFATLGTSDGSAFLVTVERAGEMIFRGFVTPELYSEPDIPVPYDVEINATDCLGELKWKTFGDAVGSGDMTVETLLTKLVRASGIDYDVTRMFRWCLIKAYTASDGRTYDLRNLYLNLDNRSEDRAYDVLNDLLLSMNADLFISGNYAYLFRKTDFDRENQPDYGEYLSLKYGINGYWPVGNLTTTLLPAKKRVTVENDCELIDTIQLYKLQPLHGALRAEGGHRSGHQGLQEAVQRRQRPREGGDVPRRGSGGVPHRVRRAFQYGGMGPYHQRQWYQ